MAVISAEAWERFLEKFPNVHLLQTLEWGKLKQNFGWEPVWITRDHTGAQILFRKLPAGLSIAYIPKGPVGQGWENLLPEIEAECRIRRSIYLKIETDIFDSDPTYSYYPSTFGRTELPQSYFSSQESIQPPRTILVDLRGSEEEILSRMKQKTRYNIRIAERKGVTVETSTNVGEFYSLIVETGDRDGFGVHQEEYYRQVYQLFTSTGKSELYLAKVEGRPVAGIMVFKNGARAWYLYGASSEKHREKMPSYLLQWKAMLWAKESGCEIYDLWGVPDEDEEQLENQFSNRSDGLWGVYRFKRGFGGRLVRSAGPYDRIFSPALYKMVMTWNRRRGGVG
jgi:peptidoglycan pentaglycine glycine transferase (the first glycine)